MFPLQVKSGKVRPSNHNQTGWTEQVIRMDKEAREEVLGTRKLPPDGPPGSKKTIPLSLTAQSIKLPDFEGTPKEKYDQLQNWLRQFVQTKPKPPEYANIANFYKIIPFNVSFGAKVSKIWKDFQKHLEFSPNFRKILRENWLTFKLFPLYRKIPLIFYKFRKILREN